MKYIQNQDRNSIAQIEEVCKSLEISHRLAEYFLEQTNGYDVVNKAIRIYNEKKHKIQKLIQEFSNYSEKGEIKNGGYEKLFQDLGIIPHCQIQLYFTFQCSALKSGLFTVDEFLLGFLRLKCNSVNEARNMLPQFIEIMNDKQKSKEVYVYFFKVYSEGKNTIKLSEALALWQWCLLEKFPHLKNFINFCQSMIIDQKKQIMISQDVWNQVWRFSEVVGDDLNKFDENEAWPVLFWDYVEHIKKVENK